MPLLSPIRATLPTHLILLDNIYYNFSYLRLTTEIIQIKFWCPSHKY
jgi:hypothetical protein